MSESSSRKVSFFPKQLLALEVLALAALALPSAAQANVILGTDVVLGKTDGIFAMGRMGAFPDGKNGFALSTTSCNQGTVNVPWLAAGTGVMQENHPLIAFLVARERNGRFEQISDRSAVKHGFFALSDNLCATCISGSPTGTWLGVGCSDTYSQFNNGDMFWLGPADEIDPWLGTWDATCSYFDNGGDPGIPGVSCDGVRSFLGGQAGALGQVGTRINVLDQDLLDPNDDTDFWYQAYYVVRGEPWQRRENNMGSRRFVPTWNGGSWGLAVSESKLAGTILKRWQGAFVRNGQNGEDDGRVHVGVKVTGPVAGMYHYEYALHNRDNRRGIGAFRLPVCPEARIANAGFHDIDQDAGNEWSVERSGSELVFSTADNALRWNTLYNFWFDSDAAPELLGVATLDEFDPGPGQDSFTVVTRTPQRLPNVYLGAGCSTGAAPTLYATGRPAEATLGNLGFGLASSGHEPGGFTVWTIDFGSGALPLTELCTYYGAGVNTALLGQVSANAEGIASVPVPIPPVPSLEGAAFNVQVASFPTSGGAFLDAIDLSDGLRVRVGDALTSCP